MDLYMERKGQNCYHRSIPDPPKGFIVTRPEKYML